MGAEALLRQANAQLQARVVEIEHLQRQLEEQSVRDPLTGLHNRRSLPGALEAAHERSARTGQPFSLVLLDIDHFKNINDTMGHVGGDAALQAIARLLEGMRQPGETVCRYGGEEFVVVLPGVDGAGAARRAEGWRAAIERQPVVDGTWRLPCTVSLGVASHPDHGAEPGAVLRAADQALYDAKRQGRNRVRVAERSSPVLTLGEEG